MSELVSNVKIFPLKTPTTNLLANGSALILGTVQCNFSVVQGKNGVFVKLPQQFNKKDEKYYNLVSFPDKDVYVKFQEAVKKEYLKATGGAKEQSTAGEQAQVASPAVASEDEIPF